MRGTVFHGANSKFQRHDAQCFTDSLDAALNYAGKYGEIAICEWRGNASKVDGYNRDTNQAIGDDGFLLEDVQYEDCDPNGFDHDTLRVAFVHNDDLEVVAVVSAAWAGALSDLDVPVNEWIGTVSEWQAAGGDDYDFADYGGALDEWIADNA